MLVGNMLGNLTPGLLPFLDTIAQGSPQLCQVHQHVLLCRDKDGKESKDGKKKKKKDENGAENGSNEGDDDDDDAGDDEDEEDEVSNSISCTVAWLALQKNH